MAFVIACLLIFGSIFPVEHRGLSYLAFLFGIVLLAVSLTSIPGGAGDVLFVETSEALTNLRNVVFTAQVTIGVVIPVAII